MYIKAEYKKIIEETVKRNQNFEGNEKLLEEFCDAVYKKTYLILATKETEEDLREYLRIISHKIIMDILKKHSVSKITEQSNNTPQPRDFKRYIQEESDFKALQNESDNDEVDPSYKEFFDYISITDPAVYLRGKNLKRKTIQKLASTIYDIHRQMPDKLYFQIFYYKYFKQLSQTQVAKKMALSQGELSKRLLELTQMLKSFKIKLY